jgi:hypothetical protein
MEEISREKITSLIAQTLRKDTGIVKALKQYVGYRCQFPGCSAQIPKRNGGYYIEVAHVQPVKRWEERDWKFIGSLPQSS